MSTIPDVLGQRDYRVLVVFDHSPDGTDAVANAVAREHPERVEPARAGRRSRTFDVVIGSRYLHGVSVVNWPLHRIALSAAANRYVRAVTGARR